MVWQASLGSIVSKTFEPGGAINILIGLGAKRRLSRPHGSLNQNHSGLPSWVVLRSIKAPISRMFFQIQNHRRTQRDIFLTDHARTSLWTDFCVRIFTTGQKTIQYRPSMVDLCWT